MDKKSLKGKVTSQKLPRFSSATAATQLSMKSKSTGLAKNHLHDSLMYLSLLFYFQFFSIAIGSNRLQSTAVERGEMRKRK